MTPVIKFSEEGRYVAEMKIHLFNRHPSTAMLVSSSCVESVIHVVRVKLDKTEKHYLADKVTGTLCDEVTGWCMSGGTRRVVGPAPEQTEKKPERKFSYASKPACNTANARVNAAPMKRAGEKNGASKLNPEKVRMIRAKKPGTSCYVMTNAQCQAEFGVGKSSIDDVRMGKTWTHVV